MLLKVTQLVNATAKVKFSASSGTTNAALKSGILATVQCYLSKKIKLCIILETVIENMVANT